MHPYVDECVDRHARLTPPRRAVPPPRSLPSLMGIQLHTTLSHGLVVVRDVARNGKEYIAFVVVVVNIKSSLEWIQYNIHYNAVLLIICK